jgi:hypothetical protein
MRIIFTLVLATIALFSYAQTTITAYQNGNWHSSSTWDLNRTPREGDIVEIPAGRTVYVVNTPYDPTLATRPLLRINLSGTLDFSDPGNDKLYLDNGSIIQVYNGGKIQTTGTSTEIIAIYNGTADNTVWTGSPTTLSGPAYATATSSGFGVGILPIKLKSFTARAQAGRIVLNWSTAEELNASYFVVEKSANARTWSPIQTVAAKGEAADYTSFDAAPASGDNFYRLKQVDLDGSSEYSHVVKVGRSKRLSVYLNPNPATERVTVSLSTTSTAPVHLQLVAGSGQVVKEALYAKGSSLISLGLQGTRPGVYTLVLRDGNTIEEASQLLVR